MDHHPAKTTSAPQHACIWNFAPVWRWRAFGGVSASARPSVRTSTNSAAISIPSASARRPQAARCASRPKARTGPASTLKLGCQDIILVMGIRSCAVHVAGRQMPTENCRPGRWRRHQYLLDINPDIPGRGLPTPPGGFCRGGQTWSCVASDRASLTGMQIHPAWAKEQLAAGRGARRDRERQAQ